MEEGPVKQMEEGPMRSRKIWKKAPWNQDKIWKKQVNNYLKKKKIVHYLYFGILTLIEKSIVKA
jgi:hypothetical protein